MSATGSSKRQAMCRLMVSDPAILRSVYDQWAADVGDVCSFEEFEDEVWECARGEAKPLRLRDTKSPPS